MSINVDTLGTDELGEEPEQPQTPAAQKEIAGKSPTRIALERLRKYAGLEDGLKPITEILKQRASEQMAKPGMVYPWREEIETELGRDSNYVDGIAALFEKYKIEGWQGPPGPFVYNVLRGDAVDVVYATMDGYAMLGVPYMPHIAPTQKW